MRTGLKRALNGHTRPRFRANHLPPVNQLLPITHRKDEILATIACRQVIVLCGATGSGKTTQLPQMCLEAGRGLGGPNGKLIGHTQPRRLAARSVAARIAEELGQRIDTPGCIVGSKVRFADTTSRSTRIKLMTDGILLAEMQGDPLLSAYDTIIIDEAHERTLNIDFLLGYLKRILPRRKDLKVIVTSATIDPTRFAALFGPETVASVQLDGSGRGEGMPPVPVIEVSGRTFPIQTRYRPVRGGKTGRPEDADQGDVDRAIADAVRELENPGVGPDGKPFDRGDILVFLPGEKEIRSAAEAVQRFARGGLEVLPLFAKLSAAQQDRIFKPTDGTRRVILATNIAETSLTVPGIRHVIDTGVARINRYDYRTKITKLMIEPISQASANQRAGRCGRVAPGVCIRLYEEANFEARPVYTDPEIRRVSLASAILRCQSLGLGAIENFPFLDVPEEKAIAEARATLFELGAIDSELPGSQLTPTGVSLARLPIDPRPAKILLQASKEGCLHEALVLVAALSSQDPRERPGATGGVQEAAHLAFTNPESDYLTLLNYWDAIHRRGVDARDDHEGGSGSSGGNAQGQSLFAFCREACMSYNRTREWIQTYHQLADLAEDLNLTQNREPAKPDAIHRAIMAGTLSGVLCRDDVNSQGNNTVYRGIRGLFASIHPGSAMFKKNPKWLLSGEIVQTTKIYARSCCMIKPEWLAELAAHLIERISVDEHFDAASGEVMTYVRETFAGVPIRPRALMRLDAVDTRAARTRARELFVGEGLANGRYEGGPVAVPVPAPIAELIVPALAAAPTADDLASESATGTQDGGISASAAPAVARTESAKPAFMPLWLAHNQRMLNRASIAEARLRRRDVLVPATKRVAKFERVLPDSVTGHSTLMAWLASGAGGAGSTATSREALLKLDEADVLRPDAAVAGNATLFPDEVELTASNGQSFAATLEYAFAPGKDEDGLTLTLPLLALPLVQPSRAQWLVGGMLPMKVAAILKQVPKELRTKLETKAAGGDLEAFGRDVAGVLSVPAFDAPQPQPLAAALAEAVEVLTGITAAAGQFPCSSVSEYLKLRVVVVDDLGRKLAEGRDIEALGSKLAPRLAKARAMAAKARFAQEGLVTWSFGVLPDQAEEEGEGGAASVRFPAIVDAGQSVSLTLAETKVLAVGLTRGGIRRLFAIAMADELPHHLRTIATWEELVKLYKVFGPEAELRDTLSLLVAERTFMMGQPAVTDAESFEDRKEASWGRIATNTKDIADVVYRTLEPRGKIAHRLSGGTNRNWVASITDLREHLAYLTPPGCFTAVLPERLDQFPRYVEAARQRLLNLREDGSGAEAVTLPLITQRFKKLTGAIARKHVALMKAQQEAGLAAHAANVPINNSANVPAKGAVLPASRRHTVRINSDAAAWAIAPGSLSPAMDRYRWLLEELRVASFAPELAKGKVTVADVDKAWEE